jgi:hypothetical protein
MTFIKGQIPWNKGKKWSQEIREKISESMKETMSVKSPWNKGKKWSKEMKKKISDRRKGLPTWNKGKKWSEEVIENIKKGIKAKKRGEKK